MTATLLIALSTMYLAGFGYLTVVANRLNEAQRRVEGGENAYIVSSPDGGSIATARCLELRRQSGIIAVGGLRSLGIDSFAFSPGNPISLELFVGEAPWILDPHMQGHSGGAVVSVNVAERVPLAVGSEYRTQKGIRFIVSGHFDPARRAPTSAQAVLVPALTEVLDRCLIEFVPGTTSGSVSTLVAATFAPTSTNVTRILPEADLEAVGRSPSLTVWVFVGASIIASFISMTYLARRPETALYRVLGLSTTGTLLVITMESMLIIGSSASLAIIMLLVTFPRVFPRFMSLAPGVLAVCEVAFLTLAFLVVSGLLALQGSISGRLKDRG